MTRFLGDEGFDVARAGKKAAHLHHMKRGGFDVPAGFVIDADEDLARLGDDELSRRVAQIGGFPVAVRSSGTLEDLAGASFAGQYETYLDVGDVASLRGRVADCRASARAERVQVYLKKQGLSSEAARVSVLVQRMVPARVAGVGFSLHPVTGREEHCLVELVAGLGEKLVAGHTTPSRYVLTIADGAVVEEEIGPEGAKLSRGEARALSDALLRLQAYFGAPQDVEWAIDGEGKLRLLQSRPITSVRFRTDVDELTNADFKDGGISARVCTPMMYGLYRDAVQESMQRYFEGLRLVAKGSKETWISSYYGRGYWNASAVKRALAKVPGFREDKFDQDLGIQKDYGAKGPVVVPTNARTTARAIPVAIALERSYRGHLGVVKRFAPRWKAERAVWRRRIAAFHATDDGRFFADAARLVDVTHPRVEQAYFTTIYNNANAQSDFKSFLASMDEATGRPTQVVKLMGGLADVRHMDVQRGYLRLYAIAKKEGFASKGWDVELGRFLEEHGFHADAELEITCPRWSEAPERVKQHVKTMLDSGAPPADPDTTIASQRAQLDDETRAIEARLAERLAWRFRFGGSFRGHVKRVRSYLSAREEMREYSTQVYALVRAYVVEAGRRLTIRGDLARPDDVFMLDPRELVALASGGRVPELAARISFRRAMYDGYRDFVPPNELGRGVSVRSEESFEGKNVLRGLGCSPGRVEGTVRVVASLDEVGALRKGDILVTRFTDPGWTPVLGIVSGVVTEVGGLLSHAAVIGREYGIPAVLNLPGATKALRSGQRVRIDGESGVVELLEDAAEAAVKAVA